MNKKKTSKLHSKNKHNADYNFELLCDIHSSLAEFIFTNKYQTKTIDFANLKAVRSLNFALLVAYYNINYWEFPEENLCPPIPGRVDYIHHLADLLKNSKITKDIKILDIGTGATCIYPILGNAEYDWRFVGIDIDQKSLDCAQKIIDKNNLSDSITLRHQNDSANIITDVFTENEFFSASMCNPPFYSSQYEAIESNARKLKGLGIETTTRNFGGKQNELWYKGGEKAFLHNYLYQSSLFKTQCYWYTALVSKKENVQSMYDSLKKLKAIDIKTIPMRQGNKVTRIVAWTFI